VTTATTSDIASCNTIEAVTPPPPIFERLQRSRRNAALQLHEELARIIFRSIIAALLASCSF
jgi:hypothetical protein